MSGHDKKCWQFIVRGKVQGVWYRAHAKEKAQQLGVTGWVKNLPNGHVELCACGDETQLTTLESWLWQGPKLAKVINVERHQLICQDFSDFSIHH